MSNEINEFLRRAAQRRAQQAAQAAQQQQQLTEPVPPPQRAAEAPRRLTDTQDRFAPTEVASVEIVDAETYRSESKVAANKLEKQIARDLDTSSFARRADRLGDVIEQSDERLESHLHDKFDHRLGNISAPMRATTSDISTEAFESRQVAEHPLRQLLNSPQNVRNAIIFNEIFKRPEW